MSKSKVLWAMPVPATAIMRGPMFKKLMGRQCEIWFSIEGEAGEEQGITLVFDGVEAFKATSMTSLGSIDRELLNQAYANLISVNASSWLAEVTRSRAKYAAASRMKPVELHHLMICFDDGPCYEFICSDFHAR